MDATTEDLLACTKEACSGPLCAESMRDDIEAVVQRVRLAQAAFRDIQDRMRSVATSENDTAVRRRMEPYAQKARGLDRTVEKFSEYALLILDALREFEQFDEGVQADVAAGISDDSIRVDLGPYVVKRDELAQAPEMISVEVKRRLVKWVATQ